MLTVLCALCGGVGVLVGLGAYLRARLRHRPVAGPRHGVRRSVALVTVSGVLLLLPDAATGVSTSVLAGVYRLVVVGWLLTVAAVMVLTSARVVDPVRSRVRTVLRRRPPTTWQDLLDRDRTASQRLLAYDHDLELAVNAPVMRDYADPLTAAAVHAMLRCDVARTPAPPPGTRRVDATEYGQAVRAFEEALAAAEAQAARLAASSVTDDERRALREAANIVDFLHSHPSTPAERAAAYARVAGLLAAHPRSHGHDPRGTRPHPFLTVDERAR